MSETHQSSITTIPRRHAIVLAADHAGFPMKQFIAGLLAEHCDQVIELGASSEEPVDFPDVTRDAVRILLDGAADRAILVCGTGAGACIAANKVNGIRAAVAHDSYVARQCVEHDDVNVLCLGAWIVGPQIAAGVIRAFLAAEFSTAPQFRRRVDKLAAIEAEMRES